MLSEFRAFALVRLKSPFRCLCQPELVFDPKLCPYILSCFPCGTLRQWQVDTLMLHISLAFLFCSISLTLAGEISLLLKDDVIRLDPLGKIQDNIFIVRSISLITSALSILPYTVAHSHIPEMTLWTSLEGHSLSTLF